MRKSFHLLTVSFIFFITNVYAQGTWQWSGRVHPELDWFTIETKHFNIHYHNGIEEIARQGASIAEQVWHTLLEQMEVDTIPKVDITFTTEDEIMNGYAMHTNMVFIWVDQNDVAVWLEDEKWLYQVISHELQHVVFLNSIKTWLPEPWGILYSGVPGWFVEGLAEYFTEKWRPYRAELSHKWHILKNKTNEMDPHHDGYSKVLYLSDQFGDSTIVKIVHHRNKLKLFRFKKAFKKATGTEVKQFEEDWRRHMNTYFYGYRAQKETIEEIGKTLTLPIKEMRGFAISPDSLKISIVGRDDKEQFDWSLYIAIRDTTKEEKEKSPGFFSRLFSSKKDTEDNKQKKGKPKIKWDLKEIDNGSFHSNLSWSPDGKQVVYAKYHFGKHQSMVWDLRVADAESEKGEWITDSFRATHPNWSPDGELIVFVAHQNNTSNLYSIRPEGSDLKRLTGYDSDTQILTPRWSPDGSQIAYAVAGPDGNCDIVILKLATKEINRITTNPEVDYCPVWHPGGTKLTFTSHKGTTPNLYTVDLETGEIVQNTDVGEAVWSFQWTPKDSTITAITLDDVDSVRIVQVKPDREKTTKSLSMRNSFTSWRSKEPDNPLIGADPNAPADILGNDRYKFYQHPKHFMSLVLPYPDGSGMFGVTAWTDAMGRHLFEIGGGVSWFGETKPWYFVGYLNAQHGPLWGVNYFYNSRWNFRFYDQSTSGLYERLDGLQFFTQIPINFGNYMTSNHSLQMALYFQKRKVIMPSNTFDKELPIPEEGKEGILLLSYNWLNRRPHKKNIVLPNQGKGILSKVNYANKSLYGDFNYTKLNMDAFINFPGGGRNAIFFRVKTVAMFGKPPAQEYVGLSRDPSIYIPGFSLTDIEDFLGFQENHNPRGWDGVRLGDRLVFGTLEYRFPLIPQLPINVLGFTLGSLTGALLSDFGNAWESGQTLQDWIITSGYEIKLALQVKEIPLLIFSVGQAQSITDWQTGQAPQSYVRLALINPF